MMILIGSTRTAKVDGARAAVEAIATIDARFRNATVEPIDLAEIAPSMPMTERAIIEGARVRATTLIARHAGELAIGVEGGLDPLAGNGHRYALKTWAAATDGSRWGYGAGGAVVLPDAVSREVVAGRELGDVIDALAGAPVRGTRGAWGVLTRDLVARRDALEIAVLAALAPFYNPALYENRQSSR